MTNPTPPVVPLPTYKGPWLYWRGPGESADGEQLANAFEDYTDLTPQSQAPAQTTRDNWAALLPRVQQRPEVFRGSDD